MEESNTFLKQKQLLNYWRAAIKNEAILGLKLLSYQYATYSVPKSALTHNGLSEEKTAQLFLTHKKFLTKIKYESVHNENEVVQEETVLPLRIAPFVYQRIHEQGSMKASHKTDRLYPVWICAYLSEKGDLFSEYPCPMPPWIAREHLSPAYEQQDSVIIGDIQDYDRFLDHNNIHKLCDSKNEEEKTKRIAWEMLENYAQKMISEVSPTLSECLKRNGYDSESSDNIVMIPIEANKDKNYSINLLKLLDSLALEDKKFSPLFSRYTNLQPSQTLHILPTMHQLESLATQHLGQITGDFPLAKSQRIALHHLLSMEKEGEILAINGPPGTGKTALLGNIVATLWVQAALKKERPPIIVVSSTNNRAIQNVIHSFEKRETSHQNSETENLLEKRWIKGLFSFGLYLTNTDQTLYQYYNRNNTGTLQTIEETNCVETKNYYLENFNRHFGQKIFSIKEASDFLHKKIEEVALSLKSVLNISVQYHKITKKYRKYSDEKSIALKIDFLNKKLIELNNDFELLKAIMAEWEAFVDNIQWFNLKYTSIVFLMPFLRDHLDRLISKRIHHFLLRKHLSIEAKHRFVEHYLNKKQKQYYLRKNKIQSLIKVYQMHLKDILNIKDKWNRWKASQDADNLDLETIFDFDSVEKNDCSNLLVFLDTKIRHMLFQYTVHYWEAQWILEIVEKSERGKGNGNDRKSKINAFKRMAMLAPCFITTMQSGPSFFTCKMTKDQSPEFMKDSIDWLIIDEASQVNPSYGAGMIALSKKACVVGDLKQLPPIIKLPGSVDTGNMQFYGLIDHHQDYSSITQYGVNIGNCSTNGIGNVMQIAQNASVFQESQTDQKQEERGLFLTEHRRCVPGIISYCNEKFYGNRMTYNRAPNTNRPFEPIAYAHIAGFEQPKGQSRINKTEAMSIAKWISEKQNILLKLYPGKTLHQIIGIITPFKPQVESIEGFLKEESLYFEKNNIGTTHNFQGGEFPIMIFSPVYTYKTNHEEYFFDREPNMLNVAVSRAKDHFFVFGDMDIFNPLKSNLPSGFLANYLFSKPENELIDVKTIRAFYKLHPDKVRHIHSLEEHRALLKNAFDQAKEKIVIISPWISQKALVADQIVSLVKSTVSRGVQVLIYTDFANHFKGYRLEDLKNPAFKKPEHFQSLKNAGAELRIVSNIHAKTILVDQKICIEGSFNWLSASRERPNYEASVFCEGEDLTRLIQLLTQRLDARASFVMKIEEETPSIEYTYSTEE